MKFISFILLLLLFLFYKINTCTACTLSCENVLSAEADAFQKPASLESISNNVNVLLELTKCITIQFAMLNEKDQEELLMYSLLGFHDIIYYLQTLENKGYVLDDELETTEKETKYMSNKEKEGYFIMKALKRLQQYQGEIVRNFAHKEL